MTARYRIRAVYDDLLGNGYELQRRRLLWWSTVEYAWLKYDKGALETLRATMQHLEGKP